MLPDPQPFLHTPTRSTQPYRQGSNARMPGMAMDNMMRGRTSVGNQNPMDLQRALQSAKPGSLWWHLLNLSAAGSKLR